MRFYEFMTIEPDPEGLILRIKHFNPGLVGWEEKEVSVEFILVRVIPADAVFVKRGVAEPLWIIYRKTGDNSMISLFDREAAEPTPDDQFRYIRQPGL